MSLKLPLAAGHYLAGNFTSHLYFRLL